MAFTEAQVFARKVKVALFDETSQQLLEDALVEWLGNRDEERLLFVSFEADPGATPASYRCNVLYMEG